MIDQAPAYAPVVITPPASEPVTVAEVATHSRIRLETAAELAHLNLLITAARRGVEHYTRRSLITQTLRLTLDAWPAGSSIYLPRPPIASISSVTYYPATGAPVVWDSSNYTAYTAPIEPGGIVAADTWPAEALRDRAGVMVDYVAGYGASAADVPEMLRVAILLIVGDYIDNREATVLTNAVPRELTPPAGIVSLLEMDRDYYYYGRG